MSSKKNLIIKILLVISFIIVLYFLTPAGQQMIRNTAEKSGAAYFEQISINEKDRVKELSDILAKECYYNNSFWTYNKTEFSSFNECIFTAVIMFVDVIPYKSDKFNEVILYPEVLNGGDCEDIAILTNMILLNLGMDSEIVGYYDSTRNIYHTQIYVYSENTGKTFFYNPKSGIAGSNYWIH